MEFQLPDSGWTPRLIFVGIVVSVGVAAPAGFQGGVINAPAEYIQQWCQDVILQRFGVLLSRGEMNVLWASVVTITVFTGMVGSILGGDISTKFGRKKSYLICCTILTVSAPCFLFCRALSSIELLFLGRAAAGLALGLSTSVLPMYLTELSPLKLRGTMGVIYPVGLTAGVIIGQIAGLEQMFGTPEHWHYALACFVVLNLLCLIPYIWLPESPEYLCNIKNDPVGAAKEIRKLFGTTVAVEDLKKTQSSGHSSEKTPSISFWTVLKDPQLRLPLILLGSMTTGCGLSGINAIFFYSVSTLERIGISPNDAKLVSLGMGCLNLAASSCGPFLMARLNRRPLMLGSCIACGTTLLMITLTIHFIDSVNWFAQASVVAMLIFLVSYQAGLGQIPFFIGSELFQLESRSSALALGSLGLWVSNLMISMLFPIEQQSWGAFAFLPCAITCFILAVLVKLYLPETRGKNVSDIALLVSNGFKSKVV